mgnify:CR=1 FL=1
MIAFLSRTGLSLTSLTTANMKSVPTLNAVLPKVGAVYVVKEGQTGPIPLLNMRDPRSTQEAK